MRCSRSQSLVLGERRDANCRTRGVAPRQRSCHVHAGNIWTYYMCMCVCVCVCTHVHVCESTCLTNDTTKWSAESGPNNHAGTKTHNSDRADFHQKGSVKTSQWQICQDLYAYQNMHVCVCVCVCVCTRAHTCACRHIHIEPEGEKNRSKENNKILSNFKYKNIVIVTLCYVQICCVMRQGRHSNIHQVV